MGLFGKSPAKATKAEAPTAKYDPYDLLPGVPTFELTSETVTHGATLAAPQRSAAFGLPGGEDISPHLAWTVHSMHIACTYLALAQPSPSPSKL